MLVVRMEEMYWGGEDGGATGPLSALLAVAKWTPVERSENIDQSDQDVSEQTRDPGIQPLFIFRSSEFTRGPAMTRIAIPDRKDTHPDAHAVLDAAEKALGFVPNLHRLMALNPKVLAGWVGLQSNLSSTVDLRTRDAMALAVTEVSGCGYCRAAHTYGATNLTKSSSEEIALNKQGKSSDPKRGAAVHFAKAVAEKRGNVEDAELAAVKAAGWSDAEIVAIVALVAQFQMTNYLNNVAQTTPDFPLVSEARTA
jgi:uncharacterized peroxidase-related enzyme